MRPHRMPAAAALALMVLGTSAALAAEVSTFGFASRANPGTFEEMSVGAPVQVDISSIEGLAEAAPQWRDVQVYCASEPGPRFMQADGRFFTLNGKSRRPGAFVETDDGRKPVDDSSETGPLSDHPMVIINLIEAAEAAC